MLLSYSDHQHVTSGGVGTFGERLSTEEEDFEAGGEERSSERRELGEVVVSDLFTALLNLAAFGVAGDDFPGGASDKLVLIPTKTQQTQV